jgi:alanine-glyoxylate transaminase/serine-glyoxylate transaminase/serine-pyruvate transaminase
MLQTHGIAVIGNIGEFAGRSFRVGLMSMPQLEPVHFDHTLHAIRALARRGQELRPP